jgi:hypothetical protein
MKPEIDREMNSWKALPRLYKPEEDFKLIFLLGSEKKGFGFTRLCVHTAFPLQKVLPIFTRFGIDYHASPLRRQMNS